MQADDCDTNLALSIGGAEFKSNDDHGDHREGEEAGAQARKWPPESASRSEDSEATETDHRAMATKKKKKLTLSKEQLALLEDSFTEHNILTSKQKHELASQINIHPRQVEVWFQNRRARTKLKQTERDCKSLKQWCEKLREENQKLREEIEELKMIRSPIHVQMPTTTLNMCPSCRRRRPPAEFIDKDGFWVKKEQSDWNLYVAGQ